MIYLKIERNAGFGNQLYMFSYAYTIAKIKKQKLIIICFTSFLDNHPFFLKQFQTDKSIRIISLECIRQKQLTGACRRVWNFVLTKIPNCFEIRDFNNVREYKQFNICNSRNYYIQGFFESYKYFERNSKELKKQIKLKNPITSVFLDDARNSESVALHVRMGDFVKLNRALKLEYYLEAIEYMRSNVNNPLFFLVTMDKEVEEQIATYFEGTKQLILVNINDKRQDLFEWCVLRACKHHIVSNSTYSWWAAFLKENDIGNICVPNQKRYELAEKNMAGNFRDFYPLAWKEV